MTCCFQRAWIGLYHLMGNWRWSLSNPSFFKPGEQDFRSWHRGEPNDAHSGENCVGMTSGLWADYDCNWAGKSLCFDATGENVLEVIKRTFTFVLILAPPVEEGGSVSEHLGPFRRLLIGLQLRGLTGCRSQSWIWFSLQQ